MIFGKKVYITKSSAFALLFILKSNFYSFFLQFALRMCFGFFNTLLDEKIYSVKCEYVKDEKDNNDCGVENEMTSDKIVENVVGGSVATHQEHIIVVDYFVSYHRTGAEGKKNKEGEGDVFLLHASHIGKCNVERTETGNRMSYARNDVIKAKYGIASIILSGTVGAENGS